MGWKAVLTLTLVCFFVIGHEILELEKPNNMAVRFHEVKRNFGEPKFFEKRSLYHRLLDHILGEDTLADYNEIWGEAPV